MILLCHAKDKISVKDNLELDSFEIQLLVRFLINNKDSFDSLVHLESLFFLVISLPLSEKQQDYILNKLNLLFDKGVVQERVVVSDWIKQRYINSYKDARRLKYVALYIFNDWFKNSATL